MQRHWFIGLILALLIGVPVLAQVGGGYDLTWHTPKPGDVSGDLNSGYGLRSVVGQPDGSNVGGDMNSGYGIRSGFLQPIDTTAPAAPAVSGTTPTSDTTPIWTWTGDTSDGSGTFRYKLDNNDLSSGAIDTTATAFTPGSDLSEGSHTLYVQERNAAGNWSSSGTFTILVDTTAPTVSIGNAPTDPTGSTEATVSFSGDDGTGSGIAGYECQLDGGAWEACSSPVSYTGLGDGEHTVTVRATDNAGNSSSASHIWTVDSTAPAEPTITVDLTTPDRTPVISGTAEPGSTITVTLDRDSDGTPDVTYTTGTAADGTWHVDIATASPVSGSLPPDGLPVGDYPFTVTATDAAGNDVTYVDTLTIASPDEPAADARTIYLPLIQRAAPPPPAALKGGG
jgi:hypothetical protein